MELSGYTKNYMSRRKGEEVLKWQWNEMVELLRPKMLQSCARRGDKRKACRERGRCAGVGAQGVAWTHLRHALLCPRSPVCPFLPPTFRPWAQILVFPFIRFPRETPLCFQTLGRHLIEFPGMGSPFIPSSKAFRIFKRVIQHLQTSISFTNLKVAFQEAKQSRYAINFTFSVTFLVTYLEFLRPDGMPSQVLFDLGATISFGHSAILEKFPFPSSSWGGPLLDV